MFVKLLRVRQLRIVLVGVGVSRQTEGELEKIVKAGGKSA